MKKQMPVGQVITDLAMWVFSQKEAEIKYHAEEIAKAILMGYHVSNFGPQSFGMTEEE
jgi:hypothetical protein